VPKTQTGEVEARVEFDSGPLAGALQAKQTLTVSAP
jgi:hypothetical protein